MNDVPILDLSAARSGDAAEAELARRIDETCCSSGFLIITGHGVDGGLVRRMHEVTIAFFHQDLDEKSRTFGSNAVVARGYRPSGGALAKSLGVDTPPDLVEGFAINCPWRDAAPEGIDPAWVDYYAPNRWPAQPAEFRATWEEYYRALEGVMAQLNRLFAIALGLEPDWFDRFVTRHYSGLLANYYPPQTTPPQPGQLRRGAHTDYGAFTLLYQDDAPGGLELQIGGGPWQAVEAIEGSFVVNIGDLLSAWTNDRWVSTMHRVVNPPAEQATRERLSIPFFVNPNLDAVVEVIPSCVGDDGVIHHPPAVAGEWVLGKHKLTQRAS